MVDLVLGIGFLGAGASGFKRGAMRDVQALLGLILGLLVARTFSGTVLSMISGYVMAHVPAGDVLAPAIPYLLKTLVFVLIFRLTSMAVGMVLNLPKLPGPIKAIDSIGGIIVGVMKLACVLWLILALIKYAPLPAEITKFISESSILAKLNNYNILASLIRF